MPFAFPVPEMRSVLRLAAPIALTQIGLVLYGTVDMIFVGRLGPEAIAAVGLGAVTYFTVLVTGMGIVMGIDSHSAKAFGAGKPELCGQLLIHTLVLALATALPLFLFMSVAGIAYRIIGVVPEIADGAIVYISLLRWCVFPALCFIAFRQFLQSMNITAPLIAAIVIGNVANALFDVALIFGRFGAPKLGVPGSAIATVTANFVMLAVAGWGAWRELRRIDFKFHGWHPRLFWDVFSLGLPAGLQMLAEVLVFSFVTALVGRLGADTLAAHQLTLQLASFTFMVPMGLSHAAAARVGQALGRGEPREAALLGRAATILAVGFMAITGVCFASMPGVFFGIFAAPPLVVSLGRPLLYCSAAFQVFDGTQAVLTGALRGLGETRKPFVLNLIGHWMIGLPVGVFLGFKRGWGATGLWIGLLTGLVVVACLLWLDWERRTATVAQT
jgi:MATE family multidrug resistance protein